MAYGFELKNTDGSIAMDTSSFGLLLADSFEISYGVSGSKAYPDLVWTNTILPTQTTQITGAVYSRTISSYAFVDFSVTRDASNIPTVHWAVGSSNSAGLSSNASDTSNANINIATNGVAACLGTVLSFGGEKRPNISITVFAG